MNKINCSCDFALVTYNYKTFASVELNEQRTKQRTKSSLLQIREHERSNPSLTRANVLKQEPQRSLVALLIRGKRGSHILFRHRDVLMNTDAISLTSSPFPSLFRSLLSSGVTCLISCFQCAAKCPR